MKSTITTKTGDDGQSSALDGERYPKSHPIMEAVGAVDELRAHLALLRLAILHEQPAEYAPLAHFLFWVLHVCFVIGSTCSDPENRKPELHKAAITEAHLAKLEAEQQRLEEHVRLPKTFVVSASNPVSAQADIACTVARRLEREVVRLKESLPEFNAADALRFVNRLSDYLFILARYLEQGRHLAVDYRLLS